MKRLASLLNIASGTMLKIIITHMSLDVLLLVMLMVILSFSLNRAVIMMGSLCMGFIFGVTSCMEYLRMFLGLGF